MINIDPKWIHPRSSSFLRSIIPHTEIELNYVRHFPHRMRISQTLNVVHQIYNKKGTSSENCSTYHNFFSVTMIFDIRIYSNEINHYKHLSFDGQFRIQKSSSINSAVGRRGQKFGWMSLNNGLKLLLIFGLQQDDKKRRRQKWKMKENENDSFFLSKEKNSLNSFLIITKEKKTLFGCQRSREKLRRELVPQEFDIRTSLYTELDHRDESESIIVRVYTMEKIF